MKMFGLPWERWNSKEESRMTEKDNGTDQPVGVGLFILFEARDADPSAMKIRQRNGTWMSSFSESRHAPLRGHRLRHHHHHAARWIVHRRRNRRHRAACWIARLCPQTGLWKTEA